MKAEDRRQRRLLSRPGGPATAAQYVGDQEMADLLRARPRARQLPTARWRTPGRWRLGGVNGPPVGPWPWVPRAGCPLQAGSARRRPAPDSQESRYQRRRLAIGGHRLRGYAGRPAASPSAGQGLRPRGCPPRRREAALPDAVWIRREAKHGRAGGEGVAEDTDRIARPSPRAPRRRPAATTSTKTASSTCSCKRPRVNEVAAWQQHLMACTNRG